MPSNESQFLSWLRLLRVANLPSALANILMGYLLAHQSWTPSLPLVLLILASACIYMAGMVLNDAFDLKVDLEQRPFRPLPAGKISTRAAWIAGFGLLLAGVLVAFFAGRLGNPESAVGTSSPVWRTSIIAIFLALLVVLYDGPLKRTICAPFLMGGCRMLNILLGASTFVAPAALVQESGFFEGNLLWGLPLIVWWVAISVGFLISGATLLGRDEAVENQSRTPLLFAASIVLVSLVGLALCVYAPPSSYQGALEIREPQKTMFPLFIGILSLSVLRRVFEAVATLKPKSIQMGVVSVLRSLIIFDAAVCYLARPDQIGFALCVLALLIPTLLLGRYMAST